MSEHFLSIGACGWDHPQWDEEFYPDDLPPEWRLGFYGNEFSIVLIPAQTWQKGIAEVVAWLDETHDAPAFVCEWPAGDLPTTEVAGILEMIRLLGERVVAISVPVMQAPNTQLVELLPKLEKLAPLALDVSGVDDPLVLVDSIQTHLQTPASLVWHGEPDKQSLLSSGELAIARIDETRAQPRSLRAVIEALLGCTQGKTRLLLLIDGQPPSLKQLRAAGVILDLL